MIAGSFAKFLAATAIVLMVLFAPSAQAAHELDNRDIASGETKYIEHCASCHGAELQGQSDWQSPGEDGILPAPPHNETGHTWHHANNLLFDYTKLGGNVALQQRGVSTFKSGMPGFGTELTDDEIWDILAYIRSTWPQRIQNNHRLRNPPHN